MNEEVERRSQVTVAPIVKRDQGYLRRHRQLTTAAMTTPRVMYSTGALNLISKPLTRIDAAMKSLQFIRNVI